MIVKAREESWLFKMINKVKKYNRYKKIKNIIRICMRKNNNGILLN
jgi:hypothetical protein